MITAKHILSVWIVLMFTEFTCTNSYEFKCPEPSQRIERSKWFCNTKQETYSCLLDLQLHAYTESCSCSFDFVRPGQKYVVSGYCKNMNCSAERYQPFKFYSSELSQCAFTKSLCSDEGQLKVNIGSTREDNACRCNSTEGYTFVSRPSNNGFCTPEQEDCSCYVLTCPTNDTFSDDFDCRHDSISMSVSYEKTQYTEKDVVKIECFDDYKYNLDLPTKKYRIIAAISVKAVCLIALSLALNLFCVDNKLSSQGFQRHNDNKGGESKPEDPNELDKEKDAQKKDNTENARELIEKCIEKLKMLHSNECGYQEDSVFETIKSKHYECNAVQTFLMHVLHTLQKDGPKKEINIVEGIRLFKIIAHTSEKNSDQLYDCIRIPAVFLKRIGLIREKRLVSDDKLPTDVNLEIQNVKKLFKKLDDELNRAGDQKIYKEICTEIAGYVEKLQTQINNVINRKVICPEHEVARVQHKSNRLINIYIDVQFLRTAYCIHFYCRDSSLFLYDELKQILDSQCKFLRVFGQPTYENVAFFALFNPSEYDFFTEYLNEYKVTLQNLKKELHEVKFAMKSKRWPEEWVVMSSNLWATMWKTKTPENKESLLFRFESISDVDNVFLITSVQWPSYFVYMKQAASLRGRNSKQGLKREWKIIRLEDGTFMLCSRKWPCKFIYMKDALLGEILAAYEYPEGSAYWDLIHENEVEIDQNNTDSNSKVMYSYQFHK